MPHSKYNIQKIVYVLSCLCFGAILLGADMVTFGAVCMTNRWNYFALYIIVFYGGIFAAQAHNLVVTHKLNPVNYWKVFLFVLPILLLLAVLEAAFGDAVRVYFIWVYAAVVFVAGCWIQNVLKNLHKK